MAGALILMIHLPLLTYLPGVEKEMEVNAPYYLEQERAQYQIREDSITVCIGLDHLRLYLLSNTI